MKVIVLGLWHLGCVTAACVSRYTQVVGLDFDQRTIEGLQSGRPPLYEPGLAELIRERMGAGALAFTDRIEEACRDAGLLWVCYDTPVDDNDVADLAPVLSAIDACAPHLRPDTLVLISSQVPVGTCRELEARHRRLRFTYSPENLRLGRAIEIFSHADRIVLGVRRKGDAEELRPLLSHFTSNLMVMRTESAEMTKLAIDGFLALSIAFMNEIARLCEATGADAKEVERGLKSENRIGPKAYLSPGGAFAGGTVARDVVALIRIGARKAEPLALIPAIKTSNDRHKRWAVQKLQERYADLGRKKIAVLGLTYKPGTDTLRRSLAVEICRALSAAGARLSLYDPRVPAPALPDDLQPCSLFRDVAGAVAGADAVIVATEWPEIREAHWPELISRLRGRLIIDPNGFLAEQVSSLPGLEYRQVGVPGETAP
ncbi:MAG: nucleotide sugar dehydrogenase [Verrucomicrobia bacterium]|nr:nucleotide sugar dehydrogenase [Verrucomicrobiota bacterium]